MTNAEVAALDALAREATPGKREWYNGCSWWRLGLADDQSFHDAIICPTIDRDGHPNLIVSRGDREFIAACTPAVVRELCAAWSEREQLRVQLAGCGVAAMQNTQESSAARAKLGDYGWSPSYSDVCKAVDREIALRTACERACDIACGEIQVANDDSEGMGVIYSELRAAIARDGEMKGA